MTFFKFQPLAIIIEHFLNIKSKLDTSMFI